MKEGRRNNALFKHLLGHVRHCDYFDDLLDVARTFSNEMCDPPSPDDEVVRTANSIWKMLIEGRLWSGPAEQRANVTAPEASQLAARKHGGDGLVLLIKLRLVHWQRQQFAASPKAMAKAQVIPEWGPQRYRNALNALVDCGIVVVIHEGGRGTEDPREFQFSTGSS